MSEQQKTALIFGITGIAGSYIARHLLDAGWSVIGVTRKVPQTREDWAQSDRMTYVEADLLDAGPLVLDGIDASAITHLVYTVYWTEPDMAWDEVSGINTDIFARVMDYAGNHLPALERVLKMQGQKYYGNHLGPYRTPSKEDDARHVGENFYFGQQDLLVELSAKNSWDYTILRPHILCGINRRAYMNPLMVIGAYASLCKHLDLPFSFPGDPVAYDTIYQATDADLLGKSSLWALSAPAAANEIYNITNGDFFRWRHIWECVAKSMDMPLAEPKEMAFAPFLEEHADVWRTLAEEQGLVEPNVFDLVNWTFGDYILRCSWDIMASTIKIRQHGFADCRDSEEMFVTRLGELRAAKYLPTV